MDQGAPYRLLHVIAKTRPIHRTKSNFATFCISVNTCRNLLTTRKLFSRASKSKASLLQNLKARLNLAKTKLEDIYAPYKPKKTYPCDYFAKELGLEPLAQIIAKQEEQDKAPEVLAMAFLSPDKGLIDPKAALADACDILAEMVTDNAEYRQYLLSSILKKSQKSLIISGIFLHVIFLNDLIK